MLEKIFLHFLILVGILCQGSIGTFLDGDVRESSSDIFVRNKRVISYAKDEQKPSLITQVPYVVSILEGGKSHCVGTILSHHTVITAALCVILDISVYKVHSGSVFANAYGVMHNVTKKNVHVTQPHRLSDGIALLVVNPPFIYQEHAFIKLHVEPVIPGTTGTVSGWGVDCVERPGTPFPTKLRSINVPIMMHRNCVNSFRGHFEITEAEICTFHLKKFCGHTDMGAPLVIDGQLSGVHIWRQKISGLNSPDVYILLQDSVNREWIMKNAYNESFTHNHGK